MRGDTWCRSAVGAPADDYVNLVGLSKIPAIPKKRSGAVRSDATSGIRQCRCCDALQQRAARTWQKKGIALMGDEMPLFLECLQLFRGDADF